MILDEIFNLVLLLNSKHPIHFLRQQLHYSLSISLHDNLFGLHPNQITNYINFQLIICLYRLTKYHYVHYERWPVILLISTETLKIPKLPAPRYLIEYKYSTVEKTDLCKTKRFTDGPALLWFENLILLPFTEGHYYKQIMSRSLLINGTNSLENSEKEKKDKRV